MVESTWSLQDIKTEGWVSPDDAVTVMLMINSLVEAALDKNYERVGYLQSKIRSKLDLAGYMEQF